MELATASKDGFVRVYDVSRLARTSEFRANGEAVGAVCWRPVGPVAADWGSSTQVLAAVGSHPKMTVYDLRAGKAVATVDGVGQCTAVLWTARDCLACRDYDELVRVIDARTWKVTQKIDKYEVKDIATDAAGSTIYCTTFKGSVALLNADAGFSQNEARTVQVSTGSVRCCAWQNNYLAVGGIDHCFSLWDTKEWICRASFNSQEASIRSVAIGSCTDLPSPGSDIPFGSLAVVSGTDDVIEGRKTYMDIGHVESGVCLRKKPMNAPTVHLSWSPTKPIIAWCGRDLETVTLVRALHAPGAPAAQRR